MLIEKRVFQAAGDLACRKPCNSGKPHLAFLRSYVFSNFKQVKTEAEAKTA